MTEDKYRELTENHAHAIERIDAYESAQKGSKRWLLAAVLTALGTAGGSGGYAYMGDAHDDKLETVVAAEVATAVAFRESTTRELGRIADAQIKVREDVARLQATIEHLVERNARARRELHSVAPVRAPAPRRIEFEAPAPEAIQKTRTELFAN